MSHDQADDLAVLDRHESTWRAQGYTLLRHPMRADVPDFLAKHFPDAVLIGRDPKVLVEVVHKGQPQAERKIRDLRALLRDHEDWRLEVLYAGEKLDSPPEADTKALDELMASIRRLAASEPRAGLVMAWTALEAMARRLEPQQTVRPQTPGRIVELLASAGYIAPSEAEKLRHAAQWRNRLVHGDLEVRPTTEHVLDMVAVAEGLRGILRQREAVQPR